MTGILYITFKAAEEVNRELSKHQCTTNYYNYYNQLLQLKTSIGCASPSRFPVEP